MMLRNFTIALAIVAVGFVGFQAVPTSALSVDDVQTQIQKLMAQINELTAQLNRLRSQIGQPMPVSPGPSPIGMQHRVCGMLNRNLAQGTKGDDVRAMQEFLYENKVLTVAPTGYFGPMTAQAVAKWQSQEGVSAVGAFGPMSRERMKMWCGAGGNGKFNASPIRGAAPLTVNFRVNVQLAGPTVMDASSYKVVFGDGQEEVLRCANLMPENPPAVLSLPAWCQPLSVSHTYTANGMYSAQLVNFGGYHSSNQPDSIIVAKQEIYVGPIACTKEYKPVCGAQPIVCITTPCNPVPTTYGNRCEMNADNAVYLYDGVCRDSANKPPVISGFSGPTTLAVNQSGTWTINASDPENGSLYFQIWWGDEIPVAQRASKVPSEEHMPAPMTSSLTHAYANAGTYTITFVVRDNVGQEAKTTTTVRVGSDGVVCTMEYAPVCGQPPEPACRRSIPACMMATPGPQTYSNRCMMNAAGASFLYEGQCSNTY